jgi:hypothetical protein
MTAKDRYEAAKDLRESLRQALAKHGLGASNVAEAIDEHCRRVFHTLLAETKVQAEKEEWAPERVWVYEQCVMDVVQDGWLASKPQPDTSKFRSREYVRADVVERLLAEAKKG